METTADFKLPARPRSAFPRAVLALSAFLLCAAAMLALSSQAAAQILATVYIENDPKFRTAEPCAALGGTLQIAGNGQVCSGIDQSGTFCIVGSRDVFPCRGLYKHVVRCNAEFIRPAVNPFICGARCDEATNGFPRGAECTFDIPENSAIVGLVPFIIPSASEVAGVAEFSGVATLAASNTGVNGLFGASFPIAGTSTVYVTGGEALVGFGFGNNTPIATIGFRAGQYVMDAAARAIVVQSGEVYWDDPLARWADAFVFEGGAKSGSTVVLTGTGFEGSATAGTFVLYEGNGEAYDVAAPDTAIFLRCDQSSNEGRLRTGDYTTECYGDLATDSTGANLALDGFALEANGDYPNPDEAMLVAGGAAMFHMRGGRGRGIGETAADYSPQITFTGENTVAIKNDAAGERYVKGGGFSIDGGAVGCDHTFGTVLRYVGGVAAYCPSGLDAFTQTEPPAPVGVANTGFVSGGVLLMVGNPGAIAGVDNLYSVVAPTGFSVDESGALSADSSGVSNLTNGPNNVIVNQRIGVVPGSGLPEERMIDLNVHKLSDTGAPVVILIGKDPADNSVFPNGNRVSGDNFGFVFEDFAIVGVDDAGLTVNNVSYDPATSEFSIGAELTESHIGDNYIVVTVTASNVRGTHIMTVNVHVVDIVQIEAANRVFPNENIAAAANYTGPIAEAAGLVNSNAQGNVTFRCSVVGGADQSDFSASATGTGCDANLNSAIGEAATSKEVQIEIAHSATPFYAQELLAPFGGQQPDGSGSSVPDTVITANITVWKAEADTQGSNANSGGEVAGVSFAPPANPDASVDFQSGGSWGEETLGADFENLVIGADGVISGTVSDRPGDDATDGIYILIMTANFMHGLLAGGLLVEMELTVSDFSFPDIPSSVDDMGGDMSVQQTLCEAYGGTFESAGGVGKCSGLWSNDSSLSCTFGSATAAGNCAPPIRGVKECNEQNRPAANLDNSITSCGSVSCPPGYFAHGASCVTS